MVPAIPTTSRPQGDPPARVELVVDVADDAATSAGGGGS